MLHRDCGGGSHSQQGPRFVYPAKLYDAHLLHIFFAKRHNNVNDTKQQNPNY